MPDSCSLEELSSSNRLVQIAWILLLWINQVIILTLEGGKPPLSLFNFVKINYSEALLEYLNRIRELDCSLWRQKTITTNRGGDRLLRAIQWSWNKWWYFTKFIAISNCLETALKGKGIKSVHPKVSMYFEQKERRRVDNKHTSHDLGLTITLCFCVLCCNYHPGSLSTKRILCKLQVLYTIVTNTEMKKAFHHHCTGLCPFDFIFVVYLL